VGGEYPFLTAAQCSAEPAIALHDLMYKQLQRLLWHAIHWQGQSEVCRKTDKVIQSPFGDTGVMVLMMGSIFRAHSRVDMDGRSIPGSKARRMAALTTRVAAIARVIDYFDQHCDTLFDLPAALRGTKGATILLAEKICAEIKRSSSVAIPTCSVRAGALRLS
jgi:hypothetical protein